MTNATAASSLVSQGQSVIDEIRTQPELTTVIQNFLSVHRAEHSIANVKGVMVLKKSGKRDARSSERAEQELLELFGP